MTSSPMSNIDKQAYRADGGDIGTGRLKEIAGNVYGDEEKCWLAKRVLALLDELEAKDKQIAELEAREVVLPKLPTLGSDAEWYQGFAAGAEGMRNDCLLAITAAGFSADRIRINGEG
ncbi:TPA: hypothetical protein ACH7TX_000882 [Escherichia coli]